MNQSKKDPFQTSFNFSKPEGQQEKKAQPQFPERTAVSPFPTAQSGMGNSTNLFELQEHDKTMKTNASTGFSFPLSSQPLTASTSFQSQLSHFEAATPPESIPGVSDLQPQKLEKPDPNDTDEALEVKVFWNDTTLDHAHFYDPKTITIGESRKNTFAMSDEILGIGLDSFPLIETRQDRIYINVLDDMTGTIQIKEHVFPLEQIKESKKVKETELGHQFALPNQSLVRLQTGEITFQLSFVSAPKRKAARLLSQTDYHLARAVGASFLFHGLFLLMMLFHDTSPQSVELNNDFNQGNRWEKMIVHAPQEKPKPKANKGTNKEALSSRKKGEKGKKPKEAKSKNPDASPTRQSKEHKIDEKEITKEALKALKGKGLIDLIGGGNGASSKLFKSLGGKKGSSNTDGLIGSKGNSSGGPVIGGVGSGDGDPNGTHSLNSFGDLVKGLPGGGKGKISGHGDLKRKKIFKIKPCGPKARCGKGTIHDPLDREIIRRVIKQNRKRFKYCYESELAKNKNLHGKLMVAFVINGKGRVSSAKIKSTSMNNDNVENCIVKRVKFMRFPHPKGAAKVTVHYPFYFKPS